VAWHDSVGNTINIQVNNGTADSAAHNLGVFYGTAPFAIGARDAAAADYWDGLIDEVGFWKRVLTADERTTLYNGGNGLAYPFTVGGASSTRLIGGKLTRGGILINRPGIIAA
jgi:hypothetical protein